MVLDGAAFYVFVVPLKATLRCWQWFRRIARLPLASLLARRVRGVVGLGLTLSSSSRSQLQPHRRERYMRGLGMDSSYLPLFSFALLRTVRHFFRTALSA